MLLFQNLKIFIFLVLISSCINTTDDKVSSSINESSNIIENVNEHDIILDYKKYDSIKMVFVPGGKFILGNNSGLEREKPEHEVVIQSFLIDKNLVTVEDFRSFGAESDYITKAEKFGDAIVYDDSLDIWQLVDGEMWEFPLGRSKQIAFNNHHFMLDSDVQKI